MMRVGRFRVLRLRLERLEERLQPSLGLFGDVLDEDIWGVRPRRQETATDLLLLGSRAEREAMLIATSAAPVQAVATVDAPAPAAGAAASEATVLPAVVNAEGGAARTGKARPPLAVVGVTATAEVARPANLASRSQEAEPGGYTLVDVPCGGGAGTSAVTWSQYAGTAGLEEIHAIDATAGGDVYGSGVGTDIGEGDLPGLVYRRSAAGACTARLIGRPGEFDLMYLYGVNVAPGGGSVYAAGFNLGSFEGKLFKLSADLSTIEAERTLPPSPTLDLPSFYLGVNDDAAGNRYVVGAEFSEADGLFVTKVTKYNPTLTGAPLYDSSVIVEDPVGTRRNTLGWSVDVDPAGEAYVGLSVVRGATEVRPGLLNVNAAGAVDWVRSLRAEQPANPNGGVYSVHVSGGFVWTNGISGVMPNPGHDGMVIGKWNLAGELQYRRPESGEPVAWIWFTAGGDIGGDGTVAAGDGLQLTAGYIAGPEGDQDALLWKLGPNGNAIIGEDYFGNPGAADPLRDEQATGLALIGAGATPDLATGGWTNEDQFGPIVSPCAGEGVYEGLNDGWLARYAQPLP